MFKNNEEFDFRPAKWLPHYDSEVLQRVRNIPREEMEVFLGVLQKMQENMERASLQSPETGGAAHI